MGFMSLWHWIVVIGVVLLLFGRGKISELMGDVGAGIKAFKKGMSEDDKSDAPKIEPQDRSGEDVGSPGADPAASGTKSREEAPKTRADA